MVEISDKTDKAAQWMNCKTKMEMLMGFIISEGFTDWFDTHMPVFHCVYSERHYDDQLFNLLTVSFADKVRNAVVKRRADFLAGRYCAGKILQKYKILNGHIGIGINMSPIWPAGTIGSISHTGSNAVAVVCRASEVMGVGIDIEDVVDFPRMKAIQNLVLNEDEVDMLSNTAEKRLLFTLVFSAKESFFKASHPTVGQYFGFDAVSFKSVDYRYNTFQLVINQTLDSKLRSGITVTGKFFYLSQDIVVTLISLSN